MAGLVPITGDFWVFDNTNSIEEAVEGTATLTASDRIQLFPGSGGAGSTIGLAPKSVKAMINSTYGTRHATPTQSEHFRGYPKPQIDVAIIETDIGSGNRRLDAEVKMRYSGVLQKVGFAILITITGDYSDGTLYTITSYGNNTGTIASGTNGVTIEGFIPNATSTNPSWTYSSLAFTADCLYYDGGITPTSGTMSWVDPDPIIHNYSDTGKKIDSADCLDYLVITDPYTVYHDSSSGIGIGTVLYVGNRTSASNVGAIYYLDSGGSTIWTTNSSGEVTAELNC